MAKAPPMAGRKGTEATVTGLVYHARMSERAGAPPVEATPDDVTLADLNFAEMCRTFTRNAGGRLLETDGLLMWAGTHPSPAIVNGLIRTRDSRPPAEELLDLAARWFGEIGHSPGVHIRLGRDADLEEAARARGFSPLIELPVMVYRGDPPAPRVPDGYTLSTVTRPEEIPEYVDAVAEPFELPEETASAFARPEALLSPFVAGALIRDAAGRPAAGAMTVVSHGVAGIAWVGTQATDRRRGLGTAVTLAAIRLGYGMGATLAALQASPIGFPIYAAIGFREVGRYRLLARASQH